MFTNRRFILTFCTLAVSICSAFGQYYNSLNRAPQHYINISLSGGEQNTLSRPVGDFRMTDKAGAAASVSAAYEIYYKRFFAGIGLSADYGMTRQFSDSCTDYFMRTTFEGDNITYGYIYSNRQDRQRGLHLAVPLQVGYWFHDYVYAAVGVKLKFALLSAYDVETQMFTQGEWAEATEPLKSLPEIDRNLDVYGIYADDAYTFCDEWQSKSSYMKLPQMAVTAEIGGKIPFSAKRIGIRAGLYMEYALPLGSITQLPLADYSAVDVNPLTQNKDNLKDNLLLNSILDSQMLSRMSHNFTIGLRLTFMFNVNVTPKLCRCMQN